MHAVSVSILSCVGGIGRSLTHGIVPNIYKNMLQNMKNLRSCLALVSVATAEEEEEEGEDYDDDIEVDDNDGGDVEEDVYE